MNSTTIKNLFEKNIPTEIKNHINFIAHQYNINGYECWLVGGPVRDLLLGRKPKDFDFATNCPLEKTKEIFEHVIETGEDHGTLTIHLNGENYEVTRFRFDVETDGRRATIAFSETIEEDLMRRDLTINAIAFNPNTLQLIDVGYGLQDIETKTLRFVGETEDRIKEDNLRFIRILRFKVKLGFNVDKMTIDNAKKIFNVSKLSRERIYDEFEKMFECNFSNDDTEFLINAMSNVMDFDYLSHQQKKSNDILFDIFKVRSLYPLIYHNGWAESFRLPTKFKKIDCMLRFIGETKEIDTIKIKQLMNKFTESNFCIIEFVLLMHSYFKGSNFEKNLKSLNNVKNSNCPIFIKDLDINGDDLLLLGFKGSEIGNRLNLALDFIHLNPELNNKKELINLIKKNY